MIVIDCSHLDTPGQLHTEIAQALDFPAYYGHNLDALYDCLTELPETTLRFLNCDEEHFPGFADTIRDATADNPLLHIIFD